MVGLGFLQSVSYVKINPSSRKHICCREKVAEMPRLRLIFLGLSWPWVGEFVGFIIIFKCFSAQHNLVNRKHPGKTRLRFRRWVFPRLRTSRQPETRLGPKTTLPVYRTVHHGSRYRTASSRIGCCVAPPRLSSNKLLLPQSSRTAYVEGCTGPCPAQLRL